MVDDALGTAAFVLGCDEDVALREHHKMRACVVDAQLIRRTTQDRDDSVHGKSRR